MATLCAFKTSSNSKAAQNLEGGFVVEVKYVLAHWSACLLYADEYWIFGVAKSRTTLFEQDSSDAEACDPNDEGDYDDDDESNDYDKNNDDDDDEGNGKDNENGEDQNGEDENGKDENGEDKNSKDGIDADDQHEEEMITNRRKRQQQKTGKPW